jgi:predicted secreted protein
MVVPLLAVLLVVGVTAGCGSGSSSNSRATTSPTSESGGMKVYTKADKNITAKVGEQFAIELESNASTGYSWQLTGTLSPVVAKVSNTYIPGPNADKLAGAPGTEKWVFKGVSKGDALVQMEYMPPGAGGEPGDTANFNVTVI